MIRVRIPAGALFNSIEIRVFVKPEEDLEVVKKSFLSLLPFNLDKMSLSVQKAVTLDKKAMQIIYVVLTKQKHMAAFFENVKKKLSDDDIRQLKFQNNRVDEDCNLFFRLDKSKILNGEYELTDKGDCFHVKIKIATYPKSREKALELVKNSF